LGGFEVTAVLLDTHIWIWLTLKKQKPLSIKAIKAIKSTDQKWIAAISCWELAKLVEKNRISFSIPTLTWIRRSLNQYAIRVADLSPEIAVESTNLRGFHRDPADQLIAATSRVLGMPLITSDKRILDFSEVDAIW
jgi:PIN domain nuclease of toxin-antitoxin system